MRTVSRLAIVIMGILAFIGFFTCVIVIYRFTSQFIEQSQYDSYIEVLTTGQELLKAGDHAQAEKYFRLAIKKHPNSTAAICGLAEALLIQSNDGENLERLREAIYNYARYAFITTTGRREDGPVWAEDLLLDHYYVLHVIDILRELGSSRVLLPLCIWLGYDDEVAQLYSASTLGKITNRAEAAQEMVQILKTSENAEMRRFASLGLENLAVFRPPTIHIGKAGAFPAVDDFIGSLKRMSGSMDSVIDPLAQVLMEDADMEVRLHIVQIFASMRSPTAVPALLSAASMDEAKEVRIAAVRALGNLSTQDAVKSLERLEAVAQWDFELRYEVSRAILNILINNWHDVQPINDRAAVKSN